MLKKYGVITLLLLGLCGVRSVLASCSFTSPAEQYINQTMASSPVSAVTLSGQGNALSMQKLFSSPLSPTPVVSTCNPTTGGSIPVSGRSWSVMALSKTMPDGGLLITAGGSSAGGLTGSESGFGYGFWYTVTYGDGSGSVSGHLEKGTMFYATPAQLNGAKWEIQAELWYVGGNYGDQIKEKQIVAFDTTTFGIGFAGADKGFWFHSPAIPITATTCNLSVDRTSVDFGAFNFLQYGGGGAKNGPTQSISVQNSNCTMLTYMEYRILSNGNPVSSDQHLLLNKLTGDDAASGFGVAAYTSGRTLIMDAPQGTNIDGPFTSMDVSAYGVAVSLYLEPDGTSQRNGKFEATATINVDYY